MDTTHSPAWRYRMGLLLVTASAVAWSTAGFFTRLIPLDTWTTLWWRGLFGALGIFVCMLAMERGRTLAGLRRLGAPGWAFAAVSAVAMVSFVASLKMTSVAHVSVVYATVPLVAAALGWIWLRERPSTSALAASIVAVLGVGIMVGMGVEGNFAGDLVAFVMTLAMAVMMVLSRRYQGLPMLPATFLSALLCALVALPFARWPVPDVATLLQLALFGLVNSALGLALFIIGSKMLPTTETALIGALDAPLAPLWVLIAFGEVPGQATVVGGLLVFVAIMAHLAWAGWRQRAAPVLKAAGSRNPP